MSSSNNPLPPIGIEQALIYPLYKLVNDIQAEIRAARAAGEAVRGNVLLDVVQRLVAAETEVVNRYEAEVKRNVQANQEAAGRLARETFGGFLTALIQQVMLGDPISRGIAQSVVDGLTAALNTTASNNHLN
jgi:hypothetical protein